LINLTTEAVDGDEVTSSADELAIGLLCGKEELTIKIDLRNLYPVTANRNQSPLSSPIKSPSEEIRVHDVVSIMRRSKNLVKVCLELVFIGIGIVLEVRLDRGKLCKNVKGRVEVSWGRVLQEGTI
jgi:hypothetical protein